jgi:Flp pilus assembly protein TadD
MKITGLTAFVIAALATSASAGNCPPPLAFADRKAELSELLHATRNQNAGQFLTREFDEIWATAPDREAQDMLDRGVALRGESRLPESEAAFDALIAYCPDFAEGFSQRGLTRFRAGNPDGALQDLDRATAMAPDHARAWVTKALVLMQLGRFAPARTALGEALAINPWLPERRFAQEPPGIIM